MSTQPVSPIAHADPAALDSRSHLTVQRGPETSSRTFGVLRDLAGVICPATLEKPGGGNVHDVNRIPADTYDLVFRHSPRFGRDMWHVEGVPGRDGILIHWGCLPCDTDGCLLVGEERGHVDYGDGRSGDGILKSQDAYKAFMAHMAGLTRSKITFIDPPEVAQAAA